MSHLLHKMYFELHRSSRNGVVVISLFSSFLHFAFMFDLAYYMVISVSLDYDGDI